VFEIGSSLREARVRQGLEIAQIESATKIRGKYLHALEDEQFELLPSETYIKGFLRTYAEHLGLDGQLYADEFTSRYVAAEEQPIRVRRTARPSRHRRMQRGALFATLAGIAIVTVIVIVAWKSGSPEKQQLVGVTPHVVKKKSTHVRTEATPKPTIVLRAFRSTVFLIAVRKNSPTGKVLVEGKELAPGQILRFKRRKLWINTGTPESLRIIVNGKRTTLPGGRPRSFVVTGHGVFASA
jgi:hypothetical protein